MITHMNRPKQTNRKKGAKEKTQEKSLTQRQIHFHSGFCSKF